MPFRLRVPASVCLFAILVSVQVLAQSNRAPHRAKGFRATGALSNFSQPSGLNFATAVPYASGGNGANAVAVADVNGDGIPDVVVANWCTDATCTASSVAVLLGNSGGTFQPALTYGSGGLIADSVAVAQLRGPGQPLDIVVANCGNSTNANCTGASGNVAVLLGNGNGTFQTAVPYNLGGGGFGSPSVAVADVNGDGKLDLVVAAGCTGGGCVGVLLGNGDGTFQTELTPNSSGGVSALSVAVADLNGDGHPDVVVANQCAGNACTSSTVGVLLGNGDGTFQTVVTYDPAGLFSEWVAIADVNGDGKPDVIVANSSTSLTVNPGNVGVLLGNGDGTLKTAVAYPSGAYGAASVAVADVNGDGKQDLVVANCSSTSSRCTGGGGTAGVLLGNGNGTFQTAVTYLSGGNTPFAVAVADVNGDSKPDILTANCAGASCGTAGPGNVGVLINATTGGLTTTALTPSQNPSVYGQGVTFTAKVTSEGFKATPTGTVSFFDGTTKIGNPNLSNGVATLTTSALALGAHSIKASYSGDSTFAPSTSPALPQAVQAAPTTTLTISTGTVAFGTSVTLTARVSSAAGAPPDKETVTFEDATTKTMLGRAALSKGMAAFTSKTIPGGTYAAVASYPGDATFLPSTSAPQPLNVQDFALKANPSTVTVSAPGQGGSTTIDITTYGNLKATSLTGWTCSGLPSESNCTFGTVGSNNQVSVSISTTASSALRRPMFGHHQGLFYAILLPGFLGMFSMAGRRRAVRGLRLLALIVVLGLAALWVACGGGSSSSAKPPTNPGTPTGNSTVTVSATSGTLQHTTTFTLAVQ